MSFSFKSLEAGGLTLLEALVGIIAPLAAAKNPTYAPIIQEAATGVNAELSNIAAGAAPTIHDPAITAVATAAIQGAATAVEANNPNAAALVSAAAGAVNSAVSQTLAAS